MSLLSLSLLSFVLVSGDNSMRNASAYNSIVILEDQHNERHIIAEHIGRGASHSTEASFISRRCRWLRNRGENGAIGYVK